MPTAARTPPGANTAYGPFRPLADMRVDFELVERASTGRGRLVQ